MYISVFTSQHTIQYSKIFHSSVSQAYQNMCINMFNVNTHNILYTDT